MNRTFEEAQALLSELTKLNQQYYESRSRLAFFYSEIKPDERDAIEQSIPLLKKQIETIKQELEKITTLK